LCKYYAVSYDHLNAIPVPMHLFDVDGSVSYTKEDIQLTIDCFYRSIVSALHYASCVCTDSETGLCWDSVLRHSVFNSGSLLAPFFYLYLSVLRPYAPVLSSRAALAGGQL